MTGFRGSHSDAAMSPPDADLARREEGDHLPFPQDKEFFESRPDAEDMEEAA